MMLIYGYKTINASLYVLVHDPWPPNSGAKKIIPYSEYVAGNDHTHWNDYYEITCSPGG